MSKSKEDKNFYRKANLSRYREYSERYRKRHPDRCKSRYRLYYINKLGKERKSRYKTDANYREFCKHYNLRRYYERKALDMLDKFDTSPEYHAKFQEYTRKSRYHYQQEQKYKLLCQSSKRS